MPIDEPYRSRIASRLRFLYGDAGETVSRRIEGLAARHETAGDPPLTEAPRGEVGPRLWDERTAILITYGDQVRSPGCPSLRVLRDFLLQHGLQQVLSGVHVLPFFPYSSDDGFSVIDYRRVDPALGDWNDIEQLAASFDLMADFVVNHCSQQNAWFQSYLRGETPYSGYFIEMDPRADLSAVTRPRSSPLLTPFDTARGPRHVWTTFSADQVDLNFANPDVLVEMLDVLLNYVGHGARIIRLDAIGFLWKERGTTCMHLPQTHEVVKLMRDVLDAVAPGTILITETNVPHQENVSYFGRGDEAHAVYQFSLAPLLLDAFLTGDAQPLRSWLSALEPPGPGRTYFNFTASHDGIGVRPLEGLVSEERQQALVDAVRARGGLVSMRRKPDGSESPYELNCTYFSALNTPAGLPVAEHVRRFLTSQAVMLALQGIPGVYFHSLLGTPNDQEGVRATGQARSINRRKFDDRSLRERLADKSSAAAQVFDGYRHLLRVRRAQPAFHPEAEQQVIDLEDQGVIAWQRRSTAPEQRIVVLASVADRPARIDVARLPGTRPQRDLLSGRRVSGDSWELAPYETAWLE
jgi:sucrose phosphorylase